MAGGFLSVPIMRPNQLWTVVHVFILAVLLLTLNAEKLRVICPTSFCNNSPPTVIWHKLEKNDVPVNISRGSHIRQEWKTLKELEGISFLFFKNILSSDSGQYRCQSGASVGHIITIICQCTTAHSDVPQNLWLYIYFAAGIVVFVFIVIIISVISMQGCKGKSKKETQTDNQYMEVAMVEQPSLHASVQPSPRGTPSAPPSRRSTRKKTPSSQPSEMPLPRVNEHVQVKVTEDRERQRNSGVEEEGSSVVYAALNHQLPPRPAVRPRFIQEECSEYAAIRLS
ncbi:hypothetical protein Q5P01_005705 [Channa striata]|uniref:Ig-like domain-containing protein n=1 Tax=Channa striata TaxID=64152 RepID=A0AA88NJ69_CHASR|nr:hypothetical protein Q5P01_005705 [Channa striata]